MRSLPTKVQYRRGFSSSVVSLLGKRPIWGSVPVSFFQVTAGNLQEASALLSSPETAVLGCGGAAAGTPVAGAWSGFVDAADAALRASQAAEGDLSRALSMAARAYVWADDSAAGAF